MTHKENELYSVCKSVTGLLETEIEKGYEDLALYADFDENIRETKRKIQKLLIGLKQQRKSIAAMGNPETEKPC